MSPIFPGMNLNVRELSQHVEYEPDTYYAAFSAELEIAASPLWSLINHCGAQASPLLFSPTLLLELEVPAVQQHGPVVCAVLSSYSMGRWFVWSFLHVGWAGGLCSPFFMLDGPLVCAVLSSYSMGLWFVQSFLHVGWAFGLCSPFFL